MFNQNSNENEIHHKNNIKTIHHNPLDYHLKNELSKFKSINNLKFQNVKSKAETGLMLVKQVNEISKCKKNDEHKPLPIKSSCKFKKNKEKDKSTRIHALNITFKSDSTKENLIKISYIQNTWKNYFHNVLVPKIIYIQRKLKFYLLSKSLTKNTLSVSSKYFEFVNNKISTDVNTQTESIYQINNIECLIKNRITIMKNFKTIKRNNDLCLSHKTCSLSYFGNNKVKTSFDFLNVQNSVCVFTLESSEGYNNRSIKNKRNKIKKKLKCKSFLSTRVKEIIENNFHEKNIININDTLNEGSINNSLSIIQNENLIRLKTLLKKPTCVNDNMITKLNKHKKKVQQEINIIKNIQNKIKMFLLRKNTTTKTVLITLNELCYITKQNHLYKSMRDLRNSGKENINIINLPNKSFLYQRINIEQQEKNVNNKGHNIIPLPKEKSNQYNNNHFNNFQLTDQKDQKIKSNAYKIISSIIKHHSSLKSKIFIFDCFFQYNNNYILTHPNSFILSSTIYNSNNVNRTEDLHGINNIINDSQGSEKNIIESQSVSTKQDIPIQNEDPSINDEQIVNVCKFKLQCFPSIDISNNSESFLSQNSFIHKKRLNHSVNKDIKRIKFIDKKYDLFHKHLESINNEFKDNNLHNKIFGFANLQKKKRQNNILSQSASELTYYNNPSILLFLKNKLKKDSIYFTDFICKKLI